MSSAAVVIDVLDLPILSSAFIIMFDYEFVQKMFAFIMFVSYLP